MAKQKGNAGIQNRHIYSRASYLYQAASYLANCAHQTKKATNTENSQNEERIDELSGVVDVDGFAHSNQERKAIINLSHQVVSDMRSVSLKAQIRQSPAIKQTICKYCDAVQIEGKTCHSTVENLSKGGRKPWADVLVTRCDTCGNMKRYPVSAPRRKRKSLRATSTPKREKGSAASEPVSAPELPT
ncbi:ribonuclease P protein subunit RPR2 [Trichoderma asperellum]|nr:Rpr2-domain-containing protein [Trichoderma asperelloides]